jgi:hypothetical protein
MSAISRRLPLQSANTDSSPGPAKSQKAVVSPGTCSDGSSIRALTCSSEIIESPGVIQKAGIVLNCEHAVFQVLPVLFDRCRVNLRTHRGGHAEGSPEMGPERS